MPDNQPPRPRQPSQPKLEPALDQQPERRVVNHPGVDGVDQPPPARRGTLPGGMAAIPERVSGEFAPTLPAPAQPSLKKTWRVPTPPSAVAAARRTPVPPSDESSPSENPSSGRAGDREAILLQALADERAKVAKLERNARASAEVKVASFPPKVEPRSPSPPAGTRVESSSAPPDAAIGQSIRYLLRKLWPFFLAAAGIGGGVTAVAKPSADPAKADATLANVEAIRRDLGLMRGQLDGVLDREATRDDFVECLYEQQGDYFQQLLPSQEHLVTAQPLRTWVDRCRNRRPKR